MDSCFREIEWQKQTRHIFEHRILNAMYSYYHKTRHISRKENQNSPKYVNWQFAQVWNLDFVEMDKVTYNFLNNY